MSEKVSTFGNSLPSIGNQVRLWRLVQGMTQAELEQKAGLSHNSVSRIECDSVSPRYGTIERLAEALGVSVEQLQFQKPQIKIKEEQAEYKRGNQYEELLAMLSKVQEPRRSMLIKTLMDFIRITLEQDDK